METAEKAEREKTKMKKLIATLVALMMVLGVAACALAEEEVKPTVVGNVQFDMDMDQVMQQVESLITPVKKEIEGPKMRGTTEFYELEYEDVTDAFGFTADIKYLFVGNGLVAVHLDMADGTDYAKVKSDLTADGSEAVPFDAAKIGNGKFAIDDDGDLKDCKEMIEREGLTIILEQDKDGDVDVTFLNPAAAYINA